jgi:UDP-2,3-diacylglucosamine hydrolase
MCIEKNFKVKNEGMYRFAENYLQSEEIDYFIFGHRHQVVNVEINYKTSFILLGDWIKNFSYGVFDGYKFELKEFKGLA